VTLDFLQPRRQRILRAEGGGGRCLYNGPLVLLAQLGNLLAMFLLLLEDLLQQLFSCWLL
jgi:hypothetical protein